MYCEAREFTVHTALQYNVGPFSLSGLTMQGNPLGPTLHSTFPLKQSTVILFEKIDEHKKLLKD